MTGSGPLNAENITGLVEKLDEELQRVGGQAERRLSGVGPSAHSHSRGCQHCLPGAHDSVEVAGPPVGSPSEKHACAAREVQLYSGRALTVKGASAEHMLAMKIRSHREIDLDDAKVLIEKLKLTTTREIQQIAEDAYEGHGGDNSTPIREGLERISKEMPELTVNHAAGRDEVGLRPPTVMEDGRVQSVKTPIPKRPSAESSEAPSKTSDRTPTETYYPKP